MGDELLPAGRLVKIEVEVCLPVAATKEQIEEWAKSHFAIGGIGKDNPLYNEEPSPFTDRVYLTDLRQNGRRVEYDRQPTERGHTYKIRYERWPAGSPDEAA